MTNPPRPSDPASAAANAEAADPIAPRIPRRFLVRFLALVIVVGAGFATLRFTPLAQYLTLPRISAFLNDLRGVWWAPLALIASFVVLVPVGVPATPMLVAGGIVFGVGWGSAYNIIGTYLAGIETYFLGRLLGRDFFAHLVGDRLKPIEKAIARRGFWSFVGIRFLPIPYPLVNYCAAFVGIRPAFFLSTTAIGLVPSLIITTYFYATLTRLAGRDRAHVLVQFIAAILLFASLTFGPQVWLAYKRRQRYRELMAGRKGRSGRA